MFTNECLECAKICKLVEEKEKKINAYQNNLFDLKSKMIEGSEMIRNILSLRNEIESLRKENEELKKRTDGGVSSKSQNKSFDFNVNFLFYCFR